MSQGQELSMSMCSVRSTIWTKSFRRGTKKLSLPFGNIQCSVTKVDRNVESVHCWSTLRKWCSPSQSCPSNKPAHEFTTQQELSLNPDFAFTRHGALCIRLLPYILPKSSKLILRRVENGTTYRQGIGALPGKLARASQTWLLTYQSAGNGHLKKESSGSRWRVVSYLQILSTSTH